MLKLFVLMLELFVLMLALFVLMLELFVTSSELLYLRLSILVFVNARASTFAWYTLWPATIALKPRLLQLKMCRRRLAYLDLLCATIIAGKFGDLSLRFLYILHFYRNVAS